MPKYDILTGQNNPSSDSKTVFYPIISRNVSTVNFRKNLARPSKEYIYYLQPFNQYTSDVKNKGIDQFRMQEESREKSFKQHMQQPMDGNDNNHYTNDNKNNKVEELKIKVLEAALAHVPKLGWSRMAITQGAEDVKLPGIAHGMFPDGGFALVSYFTGKCNDELKRQLIIETNNGQKDVENLLTFLTWAVQKRLEMIIPYKSQWSQALSLIALPQNASVALAQILTLVDDICYYAGDRSVNFNWYTRRIGLATIMKITELFMLQDFSKDHTQTWHFLNNRMEEAMQLHTILSQTEDVTHRFQRSFGSAFVTARNILGLNYHRN